MVRTRNLFPARLRVSHQTRRQNNTYRRNGKLQACEPCRKGKLRCDHMMPTCGRCARRGKSEKCVYHPAPLTKNTATTRPQHTNFDQISPELRNQDRNPRTERFPTPILAQPIQYDDGSTAMVHQIHPAAITISKSAIERQTVVDRLHQPISDHYIHVDALTFDHRSAFTNHSAVLAENEDSIGIQSRPSELTTMSKLFQSHIEKGAMVLTLLNDLPVIQKYLDKWFSFAGGIIVIEPMVKIYTAGLFSTWQKTLETQKPADLRLMSEKIWENTLRPVSRLLNRSTTPREFCNNITSGLLRWEVVGIIVTLVSLIAQSLKDGDPIFCCHDDAPVDRAALSLKMCNASEMCVSFCDELGVLNDLYLWLLYENSIAYCSMRMRGSYEASKKISTLATALLGCNLHQEITINDNTPFFITEIRKRLFICAYELDKHWAISAGKPPNLTRQYCRLQVPFDITDAQIMSEELDLVHTVDSSGWNQRRVVNRCTFARLSAANALITEEILEISLGDLRQDDLVRRATEIQVKVNRSWEDLPDFLQIVADEPWNSKHSPLELLFLVNIRLRHLDHHFLLQRTLSKKVESGCPDSSVNLLSVCSEIFGLVVSTVDHRDHFRDFQVDFVSILMTHGIPAAAVLAVELLHQEQSRTSASTTAYPLHRSDTVQRLSVFVACLGTIRRGTSGFESCDRGRRFLKKILDMVLSPGPAAPMHTLLNMNVEDDPTLGAPLSQPASDGDFVRWLEGMDWDQESLVNFSGLQ